MSQADFTDTAKVERRLRDATNELHKLVDSVALARQVKEFSSERRKTLLARFAAPLMAETKSLSPAESLARWGPDYIKELTELETQYREAERTISKWQATQATFEAARSLLSMSKELLKNLPE